MAADLARRDDGAALIEAAFVLPILLLLVLAVADLSLYFWNANLAGKSVQLGLRRAVVSDSVAVGPGLDPADSETYWDGLEPGARCEPGVADPCPRFAVTCTVKTGCTCSGNACRFTFAPARLAPILDAMRAVVPDLLPENLVVSYATGGLGYVGRPVPVPVEVGLGLVGRTYEPAFLGALFGTAVPLRASATMPGETLRTR